MIYRFSIVLFFIMSNGWGQNINWVELEDVRNSNEDKIVFVVYTADWCKPCIRFRKVLNNNSDLLNDNYHPVKFVINSDWSNIKNDVEAIPLVRLYKYENGSFKFVEEFDGEYDDENTKLILNEYIK